MALQYHLECSSLQELMILVVKAHYLLSTILSERCTYTVSVTLLWASVPPTHAAIVFARGARTTTESGVVMTVASAVRMQGFENRLGLFMALVLHSYTAF